MECRVKLKDTHLVDSPRLPFCPPLPKLKDTHLVAT